MPTENAPLAEHFIRNPRRTISRNWSRPILAIVLAAGVWNSSSLALSQEVGQDYSAESNERVPWTTSRLVGSPDPPRLFVTKMMFADSSWSRPLYAKPEPGGRHLFVIEQGGEPDKPSKIFRIRDQEDAATKSLVLSIPRRLVYSLEFHPDYASNGFVYLFSNGPTGEPERENRVTRYTMKRLEGHLRGDPHSAQEIIHWRSMGHDGGDLAFGNDGMLYITSGDGTSDSDKWLSAQDPANLLGGVLRIDVDQPSANAPYSLPTDNPFRNVEGARGEWWAIGLRNPWRMSVDRKTGQIWVGNNGQDLWETAHLIRKGENYGWSVYEGNHPFYAHRELGPGRLTAPTFEHHHTEARSLTGGVTYRGARWEELAGAYIYGDYSTGKIWAGRHDGEKITFHQEIADTALSIVGFSNSHRGDLIVVDSASGLHRLERNPDLARLDELPEFPKRLSETGLFESTPRHQVAKGLVPYAVVAPGWADGAQAKRYIAVPDDLQVRYTANRGWNFPNRSVLVQTLFIDNEFARADSNGQQDSRERRLETRILLRQQNEWQAYSYLWNAEQTDGTLVGAEGAELRLSDDRIWRVPSRAECMSCHARAVNYALGLTDLQMNREFNYSGTVASQLETLARIGLLAGYDREKSEKRPQLVNPFDASARLAERVKSYLHANCSCCHVNAGGGNARMELEYSSTDEAMRILDEYPQHDSFGLSQPRIVAPGEPEQSVMLARISRRGRGQMPPLGTQYVDQAAAQLFREWIASLPPRRKFVRDWSLADLSDEVASDSTERSRTRGKELFRSAGCSHCHRIEDELAGIGPNLAGISDRGTPVDILQSIIEPSAKIAPKYAAIVLVTSDGEILRGRILSEDDEVIVLRGQESFAQPRRIPKVDIEERVLSRDSMMPTGTVNHLQREQILDLIAYIMAGRPDEDE